IIEGFPRINTSVLEIIRDKYVREMSSALENEYVHTAYSRLATYQKKDHRPSSPRIWPNVRKFLESQASGSTVIDVGRDNTADAVLNVSVLHHLSTANRRKAALEECARCLRPGGRMLTYVWAYEQPNGTFPSQDLLVPWNLSEIPIN
ncbi:hypothetical protein TELCIR_15677, partial [Teladorsagia circumcincta]